MRKLVTFVCLLTAFTLHAQDLKSLFIALPDSLSPLLTEVNRQDFGDFLQSGMKAKVKNRFGKTSEMLKLTDTYLELQLTSVSKLEMKLLSEDDSTQVICVAKTYQGPVADTQLAFYSTQWTKQPTEKYIQLPTQDDFFIIPTTQEGRDSLERVKMHADIHLVAAKLSETEGTVTFRYTVPDYLDKETADQLKTYLNKDSLCYEWLNGQFVVKQK